MIKYPPLLIIHPIPDSLRKITGGYYFYTRRYRLWEQTPAIRTGPSGVNTVPAFVQWMLLVEYVREGSAPYITRNLQTVIIHCPS